MCLFIYLSIYLSTRSLSIYLCTSLSLWCPLPSCSFSCLPTPVSLSTSFPLKRRAKKKKKKICFLLFSLIFLGSLSVLFWCPLFAVASEDHGDHVHVGLYVRVAGPVVEVDVPQTFAGDANALSGVLHNRDLDDDFESRHLLVLELQSPNLLHHESTRLLTPHRRLLRVEPRLVFEEVPHHSLQQTLDPRRKELLFL